MRDRTHYIFLQFSAEGQESVSIGQGIGVTPPCTIIAIAYAYTFLNVCLSVGLRGRISRNIDS